jgi:hypothetical protein
MTHLTQILIPYLNLIHRAQDTDASTIAVSQVTANSTLADEV